MADIANLSGLAPVEQLDFDNYAANQKKSFQLPKRGVYTLQSPESFPSDAFGVSNAGALTVQIDPTIVDGPNAGFKLRYTKVSAKVYQRAGTNVSKLGDYLKACGITGVFKTPQELADAAEITTNATYQAELDWRAYKDGFKVEGMTNFPAILDEAGKPTGEYQSWVSHPTLKNENGEPVRVFANLTIKNFLN